MASVCAALVNGEWHIHCNVISQFNIFLHISTCRYHSHKVDQAAHFWSIKTSQIMHSSGTRKRMRAQKELLCRNLNQFRSALIVIIFMGTQTAALSHPHELLKTAFVSNVARTQGRMAE
jgi:hypothetical protein